MIPMPCPAETEIVAHVEVRPAQTYLEIYQQLLALAGAAARQASKEHRYAEASRMNGVADELRRHRPDRATRGAG